MVVSDSLNKTKVKYSKYILCKAYISKYWLIWNWENENGHREVTYSDVESKKLPEKPLSGIQVFQFIVKYWSIGLLFNTGYLIIVTPGTKQ